MFLLNKLTRLLQVQMTIKEPINHSIETYAYGTSKDLVNEKEEIKCNNIIERWLKSKKQMIKKLLKLMML